jgi:thioredoxin-related protein
LAKPAVDGLQRDLEAQGLTLIRLNVGAHVGAQLARQYAVRGVPTLLVFDGSGEVAVRQIGRIVPAEALAFIESH